MSELSLTVRLRKPEEKNPQNLRKNGWLPAVLYGPEIANKLLAVEEKEFLRFLKTAPKNKSFQLKITDDGSVIDNVLLHEVQRHHLEGKILNIDFYQFSAKKKVKLAVPLEFVGRAPALDLGGVIVPNMDELEVECLPINIPEKITVDLSVLTNLDSTIYLKDLNLPEGVVCHFDPMTPIVSVTEAEKEVVEPVASATPEGGTASEKKTESTPTEG